MKKLVRGLLLLSATMLIASCGSSPSSSPAGNSSGQPTGTSTSHVPTGNSSGQPTGNSSAAEDDEEPVISGVQSLTCEAGKSLNLLEGVTAADDKDGDITSKIQVSIMPERPIVNGVVTFGDHDEGEYDVCYKVTDSAGNEAEVWTTVNVTAALGEKTLVHNYDFARGLDGWAPEIVTGEGSTAAGTHGISHGKYVFDITNSDGVDWHVKHAYYNYPVKAGHTYEIKAIFDSTVAGKVMFLGAEKDAKVGRNEFTGSMYAPLDGGRNIEIQFGKLPGPFKVSIEKIVIDDIEPKLDETKTAEIKVDEGAELTKDWAYNDGNHVEFWDDKGAGITGELNKSADKAELTITSQKAKESWRAKYILNLGANLEAGKKYHFAVTYTSTKDLSGLEFGVGKPVEGDDFKSLHAEYDIALTADVAKTFEFDVVAANGMDNPMVCLKVGSATPGAVITVSNFSVTAEAALDMRNAECAAAWSDNDDKRNTVVPDGRGKNYITTAVSGDARGVWQDSTDVKIADFGLAKDKAYRISFKLKATAKLEKIDAMMGKLDTWDPDELFRTETINLEANETKTFTAIVTPGENINGLKLRVKYGNAAGGTQITLSDLKFEAIEFVAADAESILPAGWNFKHDKFTVHGEGDNAPTVVANDNDAVFTATKKGDLWQAKAVVESRTELKKGKKYHLALDVVASAKVTDVEFGAGFIDGDFKQIDHNYGVTLEAGVVQTISYYTAALDKDYADTWGFGIFFGKAEAGTTLTVSNLKVEAIPDASEKVTTEWNFLPENISIYAKEDAGAQADLYVENGELVWDLIKISHDGDWYNKLTIDNIVLDGGALYIFEVTAKASVALDASLVLNKKGAWDPRGTVAMNLTTEYQTFSFTTDVMTAPLTFELLMQDLHQNTGVDSAKITFQSIKLYSQAAVN